MSTYHARPPETLSVELPFSRSPFKVPEADVMILTVIPPQRAYNLAESINPTALLKAISDYQLPVAQGGLGLKRTIAIEKAVHEFKAKEKIIETIAEASTFTPEQRAARADSLLCWWNLGRESAQPLKFDMIGYLVIQERIRNPRLRLIVKADRQVLSGVILRLMETLQDPKVNMLRFSMMTMLEEIGSAVFVSKGG